MSDDVAEDDRDPLGWHVIPGTRLLEVMRRVESGERADLVYAEMWANAEDAGDEGDEGAVKSTNRAPSLKRRALRRLAVVLIPCADALAKAMQKVSDSLGRTT